MRGARTAERLAVAAISVSVTTLAIATFSLARCANTEEFEAIVEARARIERAKAVRYGPASDDRDRRFDALIGAMAVGLGTDAPADLRDAVTGIQSARAAERGEYGAPRVHHSRAQHDDGVDDALVRSTRLLSKLAAEGRAGRLPAPGELSLLVFLTAVAVASLVSTLVARILRGAERERLAELVGAPRASAHDGSLAGEVGCYIALASALASAQARQPHRREPDDRRSTSDMDSDSTYLPAATSLEFGRIIEIRAVDPDE
jgi:hypothetical protein